MTRAKQSPRNKDAPRPRSVAVTYAPTGGTVSPLSLPSRRLKVTVTPNTESPTNKDGQHSLLLFVTKVFFSTLILLFCALQIHRDSDSCSNPLLTWYCSIIGVIVTAWVPKVPERSRKGLLTPTVT